MFQKILPIIFLSLLGISNLQSQSNFEPVGGETALDTARGKARMQLLVQLCHKYSRTNSIRSVELLEEAFEYQKEAYKNREEYLKQRLALLGWSSEIYFFSNQKDWTFDIPPYCFHKE